MLKHNKDIFKEEAKILIQDAVKEMNKATKKFPQPNYVTLKVAEESGELVKEAIHYSEGRGDLNNLRSELVQTLAMCLRLYKEGDEHLGVPPLYLNFQDGKLIFDDNDLDFELKV